MEIGAARVAQARALVGMAGAGLYPVIAVDAGSSRTWFSGNPAADSASAGVGVTWEADLWGSARYAQASAASTLLATRFGQEALRQGLVADVAAVYFQILAINDSLKVARDNLANVQRLLAVIEAQKQAGRISALELAQQRTVQASAEAAIPPLLQRRRTSLDALALLAGRTPEALTVTDTLLSSLAVPAVPLG
ncbi:MAG: TolC family protein, partial [Candidatus Eisenbacteria bacterium]|nr:TolC family protein [Candidatus Eisenbacteria bacterium]